MVLTPAACYPLYPAVAARGPLPEGGLTLDTGDAYVFRREPSDDPARMQIFHMREIVRDRRSRDGPELAERWRARAEAAAARARALHWSSTSPPIRSSGVRAGCSPPRSVTRSSSGSCWPRSPAHRRRSPHPTTTRTISGTPVACGRWTASPRTPAAWPSARSGSRWRCSARMASTSTRGPTRCRGPWSSELTDVPPRRGPSRCGASSSTEHRPHALHAPGRTYVETQLLRGRPDRAPARAGRRAAGDARVHRRAPTGKEISSPTPSR